MPRKYHRPRADRRKGADSKMHSATEKVGVGFIGAGQISELHARAYQDNPTGRLVAVADSDPRVAEEKAKLYGAERWYTDYRDLLEDESVDAVEVLVPHHLHLPVTLDSLRAGKHTSLQKPMALTGDEADQMIAATSDSGKLFRVFENFRSYEPFIFAKKMIDNGEIGEGGALKADVTVTFFRAKTGQERGLDKTAPLT